MARARILRSAFNGGEASPRIFGRVDLAKYPTMCETMENLFILPQGGFTRRPGTRYVASTKNDGEAYLRDFKFSEDQAYALELGDHYCRFFEGDGQDVVPVTTAQIVDGDFSNGLVGWTNASTGGATVAVAGSLVAIAGGVGTPIGNLTEGPGLAAAFDGVTAKDFGSSPSLNNTSLGLIGKDLGAAKVIGGFKVWGTTDEGLRRGENPRLALSLQVSSDNFATSVVTVGTLAVTDGAAVYAELLSGVDATTAYRYVRLAFQGGNPAHRACVAAVQFFELVPASGAAKFTGVVNQAAIIRQSVNVAPAYQNQIHVMALTVTGDVDQALKVRIGTTAGGADYVDDQVCRIGHHLISFTPSTTPIWVEMRYDDVESVLADDVSILSGVPLELTTEWALSDVPAIRKTQAADLLYTVDGKHRPLTLARTGLMSWSQEAVAFLDGPYQDEDISNTITVTASDTTGDITLTADAALWQAGHVGSVWRLSAAGGYPGYNSWGAGATIGSSKRFRISNDNVYYAEQTGTTGGTAPQHSKGTVSDGAIDWTYVNTLGWGVVLITGYTSPTSVAARVLTQLDDTVSNGGTTVFRKPAFSDVDGWPSSVEINDNRLIYGKLTHSYQSVVGKFDNFRPGAKDDDAITATLGGGDRSPIMWIKAGRSLLLCTSAGPWVLRASTQDGAMTPANITARVQGHTGASPADAIQANTSILYLSRGGTRLFALGYQIQDDQYDTSEQTELSDHILQGGITEMTLAREPWQILWCARADGQAATYSYDPTQGVQGWSRQIAGGSFAGGPAVIGSACAVPGTAATAGRDRVWLVVKRTILGQTRRFVEFVDQLLDYDAMPVDAYHVDAGLVYSGAPVTSVSGLGHLEGQSVAIAVDGGNHARKTVVNGAVTLDVTASRVAVGLPYKWRFKSLKIADGGSTGPRIGAHSKPSHVWLGLVNTTGGRVGNGPNGPLEDIDFRQVSDEMDTAVPLFTSEIRVSYPAGWSTDPRLYLEDDSPLPFTLTHAVFDDLWTNELVGS